MGALYDVFISFKNLDADGQRTSDSALADEVYRFLTARDINAFCSNVSLESLGTSAYKQAIDDALDQARVLIAVGTTEENLASPWVRYEWDSFFNDILSGVKREGRVFVYYNGKDLYGLPRALRQTQVIQCEEGSLERLYNFVSAALGFGHAVDDTSYISEILARPGLEADPTAAGEELRTISGHSGYVTACTVSLDGRWIVSASYDKTLKVWDAASGCELRTLTGHGGHVNACAINPDGTWIVSASDDSTLKVWDAESGRELRALSGHRSSVTACAISPDGAWIVSASSDSTLRVWDAQSGRELRTLSGHRGWVTACAVSPDGSWIVSASSDSTLKVWDAQSGEELRALSGHGGEVFACAVSPDGAWIVSASDDTTLKVWDAATGRVLHTLIGHGGGVTACAVSPEGTMIVSAGRDSTLKVWDAL